MHPIHKPKYGSCLDNVLLADIALCLGLLLQRRHMFVQNAVYHLHEVVTINDAAKDFVNFGAQITGCRQVDNVGHDGELSL